MGLHFFCVTQKNGFRVLPVRFVCAAFGKIRQTSALYQKKSIYHAAALFSPNELVMMRFWPYLLRTKFVLKLFINPLKLKIMGKIKQGILGGFSGKVGSVVGGSWKGISYMRGKAASIKNPQTLQQMKQRGKFALALSVLQPITVFVRIGFKRYAHRKSEFNAAMSYTIRNAIQGTYPDYTIDYSKLLVSRGTLTGANTATATPEIGKIKLAWENNSGIGEAKPTDKALAVAINPEKGEAAYITDGAPRSACTENLLVSPYWAGDEVEVYLAFISENGKDVASSAYLGSVTVE
jgi:hypothetical protein